MADKVQVQRVGDGGGDAVDHLSRAHDEKLQGLARTLVSSLYMLVRSAKLYDPDNAVFDKPLVQLRDAMNAIIQREGKLELFGVQQSFYLNGMLVKVDAGALDNVKFLLDEMRAKDVAGLTLLRSVAGEELKNFIWIFSKEQTQAAQEEGLAGKRLMSMRLASWSKLKDRLERERDESEAKLDRKKYALTCYARVVFFVRKYVDSLRADRPVNTSRALRLVQDLVDLSYDHRTHFLGLTTTRTDSEYLVYHQVNTCLMAVVLGAELGMTKPQLRDLGYIALFHDAGMAMLPDELLAKSGALTDQEKALVTKAPLMTVRNILRERSFNRATLLRLITVFEHKVDFGTAVKDDEGNVQMILPKSDLGLYARIIAICSTYDALTSKRPFRDAYGPQVALMLMFSELRNKFDPDVLRVFMKVMAIQPVRVLSKRQQKLKVGLV